jgi:hypothetical protein
LPRRRPIGLFLAALMGCRTVPYVQPAYAPIVEPQKRLKLHMKSGELIVLDAWARRGGAIEGEGASYDIDRAEIEHGHLSAPLDEIALVELSRSELIGSWVAIAGLATVSAVVTAFCLAMPKSCFGSCPTFYVPSNGGWKLQAEGFSTSIARALEADDLDALPDAAAEGGFVSLAMRNEALETHAVRSLGLLLVDGPAGSTIYRRTGGGFDALGPTAGPTRCAWESDVCPLLAAQDGRELQPKSDGVDLAAKTSIELWFDAPPAKRAGLVLTARNSLMSTFVLYHMLALYGRSAGDFIAKLEAYDPAALLGLASFSESLGGIEIAYRQGDGPWKTAPTIAYIGPIALQTQAVPLELDTTDPIEVRLTMARAHWKLDAARVGPIIESPLSTTRIAPEVLEADGQDPRRVEAMLRGIGPHLVTLPGEEVRMRFAVPEPKGARAYFLQSRGYYYEWMREEWLREEDPAQADAFLADPLRALRELAPEYARIEPSIDRLFENSRFARPRPGP